MLKGQENCTRGAGGLKFELFTVKTKDEQPETSDGILEGRGKLKKGRLNHSIDWSGSEPENSKAR